MHSPVSVTLSVIAAYGAERVARGAKLKLEHEANRCIREIDLISWTRKPVSAVPRNSFTRNWRGSDLKMLGAIGPEAPTNAKLTDLSVEVTWRKARSPKSRMAAKIEG